MSKFRVTFLGTGTSQGVPMIGCDCAVCRSEDPRNNRMRCSIYIETDAGSMLVDTTPDLRTQALRSNLRQVDAVLMTHTHTDHVAGFDDLRRFSDLANVEIPIYASPATCAEVRRMFPFVFDGPPKKAPYLRARLCPLEINKPVESIGCRVTPVNLPHGRMTTTGFLFEQDGAVKLAYLNDCKEVPEDVLKQSIGARVMVLDALRFREHPTHMCLDDALAVVRRAKPARAFLTHMTHEIEHGKVSAELPESVALAYDGLVVEV